MSGISGHVRHRATWEVVLDFGEVPAQRCAECGWRQYLDRGSVEECPKCGGRVEASTMRRQRQKAGYHTKKEALQALSDLRSAYAAGTYVESSKTTVGEYLDAWLKGLGDTVAPATRVSYTTHCRAYLIPRLGHYRLQQLSVEAVNAMLADLGRDGGRDRKGLSGATRRRIHATLRKALNDAVRGGRLMRNVASLATLPKAPKAEMRMWEPAELRAFLDATAADRLHPLWALMAATGCRCSEALGLRWADVRLGSDPVISIQRARVQAGGEVVTGPPRSDKGRRDVQLLPETAAVLMAWQAAQADEAAAWGADYRHEDWVFTKENGEPLHPATVSKAFGAAVKAAKVPAIRPHDLRHGVATMLFEGGVAAKTVQAILGHSDVALTLNTYTHVRSVMQRAAME